MNKNVLLLSDRELRALMKLINKELATNNDKSWDSVWLRMIKRGIEEEEPSLYCSSSYIDKLVKESKTYKALEACGCFDYEEDLGGNTFYAMVRFMENIGAEIFYQAAEELSKNEETKESANE